MTCNLGRLCFECRACEQICSRDAIRMHENEEGFSYPRINVDLCIDCGLCHKVCPAENAETCKRTSIDVYAAQSNNDDILSKSSSGGIFSLIAQQILNLNGVVYGAAWDNNLHLKHIGVETEKELNKLRGSKYVHSDIGNTYKEIRQYLKERRWVYFTGTPCQVAGLKMFLKRDYETLFTSDLICHGTPSQKIFDMFVKQMEDERGVKLIEYSFRDKSIMGWSCSSSSSSSIDRKGRLKKHIYDKNMNAYYRAFISGKISRMDCYNCPFAEPRRVGDITLADYWGIKNIHPEFANIPKGVSLILVNTAKGMKLWENINSQTTFIVSSIENVMRTSNDNIKHPTVQPSERGAAYQKAFNGFIEFRDSFVNKEAKKTIYKVFIKKRLKKIVLFRIILNALGK